MKNRDHRIFLKDIIDSIEKIESFASDMKYRDFIQDDKTVSAVVRKLEIIGEAVKNLPKDIRLKNKDIPWREMAGMRDKLIHWYFNVDFKLIWKVIKEDLPKIRPSLIGILDDLEKRG